MAAKAKRARRPDSTVPTELALPPAALTFGAYEISDLTSAFQCRYPFTEPGQPTRYCGKPIAERPSGRQSSWCCHHLPIVFDLQRGLGRVLPKKGRG